MEIDVHIIMQQMRVFLINSILRFCYVSMKESASTNLESHFAGTPICLYVLVQRTFWGQKGFLYIKIYIKGLESFNLYYIKYILKDWSLAELLHLFLWKMMPQFLQCRNKPFCKGMCLCINADNVIYVCSWMWLRWRSYVTCNKPLPVQSLLGPSDCSIPISPWQSLLPSAPLKCSAAGTRWNPDSTSSAHRTQKRAHTLSHKAPAY